jgi:uncharacterized membrane-anchored protein YjiN (DUF445 family)
MLVRALERGDLAPAWSAALAGVERALDDDRLAAWMAVRLEAEARAFSERSLFTKVAVRLGEATQAIDYDVMARRLLATAAAEAARMRFDATHAVRKRIDERLLEHAKAMVAGDEEAAKVVGALRRGLAAEADLREPVEALLGRLRATLEDQAARADGALVAEIRRFVERGLAELKADAARRARLDAWLRGVLADVIDQHHHLVGEIVRESLSPEKLPDEQLVRQLESKVGDDLQFIRLNGAVVGFLVGLALGAARAALLR